MNHPTYQVLVLCTGNSARSVMTEVALRELSNGQFQTFSAGSKPTGRVNPFAIQQLANQGFNTDGLRSKSWDEFAVPDAPVMDFILTVCDNAAGEVCPLWLGHPYTIHWGFSDPAAVEGSDDDKQRAFDEIYQQIYRRIQRLMALPLATLTKAELAQAMRDIGEQAP
ncbi:MAG TPA: arsenate reductase ArsC [Agitococcus sp.]|nr:arsenate reductase ArsC [Agitococcus sp.]